MQVLHPQMHLHRMSLLCSSKSFPGKAAEIPSRVQPRPPWQAGAIKKSMELSDALSFQGHRDLMNGSMLLGG